MTREVVEGGLCTFFCGIKLLPVEYASASLTKPDSWLL